jgi:hypothetical protein
VFFVQFFIETMLLAKATLCLNSSSSNLKSLRFFWKFIEIFLDCNNCSISEILFFPSKLWQKIYFILKWLIAMIFGIPHNRRLVLKYYCFQWSLFQNTEQRQEIYPNKPLLINLKSFFSDLNCPKTLESLLNIRVSIDTFLRYRQERFVNCFIFYFMEAIGLQQM